ncbi:MAG: hypothetical protein RIK87_21655 [Fuerstiella sp.]
MKAACLVLVMSVLFLAAGCGSEDQDQANQGQSSGNDGTTEAAPFSAPAGFETPDAAFAAFQNAAAAGDYRTAVSAMTLESQQALAGSLIFALSMMSAFDPENADELTGLMEKHGISEEHQESGPPPEMVTDAGPAGMVRGIGAMTEDPAAFVAEAMEWMEKSPNADGNSDFAEGRLGTVTVEGDSATATLSTPEGDKPIEFRRNSSGWLVHIPDEEFAMAGALGGGGDMSGFDDFDFHYDEEDELPPPDALTIEEFDQAWKTSVDYKDRVALEALTEVAAGAGLTLFDQPELMETLQQTVSVKLQQVSRLQVIEEICEQLNLYPRYKLKTVGFGQGPRPVPVTYAGPFVIAVTNVMEHVPYATGELELSFFAAGIPAAMAAQLVQLRGQSDEDEDGVLTLKLDSISGGGQDLPGQYAGGSPLQGSVSTVLFSRMYRLRNLLRNVESVQPISGRISWAFPTAVTTLKFDELKEGAVAESGDIKVTLINSQLDDSSQFSFRIEGTTYDRVAALGRDADGEILKNDFTSGSGFGDQQQLDVMMDGRPAALEARIVAKTDRLSYQFTIPEIPLPSHEEMPEQLTDLMFEGSTPLSIEFTSLGDEQGFRKISLRVTNHSNKDIHMVQMKLDYLGSDGAVLKDWSASEAGNRVLVAAGQSADIEVTGFFMPDETTSVRAIPESIEFADATEWLAE